MEIQLTESKRIKNASACIREGMIHVSVPARWSVSLKNEVTLALVDRVIKQQKRDQKLIEKHSEGVPRITLSTLPMLTDYVTRLNHETFNAPLKKVRIGHAKYTRLAQVNLKTRVMTVSYYCLNNVPESALRYLIIHELAHFYQNNHSKRFWDLVAQYVPDYRKQSRLMKAFHQLAVHNDSEIENDEKTETPPPELPIYYETPDDFASMSVDEEEAFQLQLLSCSFSDAM